jgi:hypothetical protein
MRIRPRHLALAALAPIVLSGCGADGGVRPPKARERAGIVAGARLELASVGARHSRVHRIRVSRRDPHFAYAEVDPLTANGEQVAETADMVLVEAAGQWNALLVGTDLASVCTNPDPRPIRELLRCRDDVPTRG